MFFKIEFKTFKLENHDSWNFFAAIANVFTVSSTTVKAKKSQRVQILKKRKNLKHKTMQNQFQLLKVNIRIFHDLFTLGEQSFHSKGL